MTPRGDKQLEARGPCPRSSEFSRHDILARLFPRRAESAAITASAGATLGEAGAQCGDSSGAEGAARRMILCIEDNSECAALIKEELKERGFDVAVAHNGRTGLSMLQEMKVDLVLADVNMPEMSGFEVLERLNEISGDLAKVPFIFVTGLSDYESEIAGRTLGADDYVKKPIDFDILQTIIDARLAGVARLRLGKRMGVTMSDREIEALTWVARGKISRRDRGNNVHRQENRGVPYRQRSI